MLPDPIWIHPSCQMAALATLRRQSLPSGKIPHLFHYEGLRQSQLWQEVAKAHAPDSEIAYREIFKLAKEAVDGEPVHVVGLGAGGAEKERRLLDNLSESMFTPVDVSSSLALLSAQNTRDLVVLPPKPLVCRHSSVSGASELARRIRLRPKTAFHGLWADSKHRRR